MWTAVILGLGLLVAIGMVFYFFRKAERSQKRVEELLLSINNKDILLDRSAHYIEQLKFTASELQDEIVTLQKGLDFQQKQFDKLGGQKKSSEVRTGKIVEQMAPFLTNYPQDPKTARFLGDPIDFIHFDEDAIRFVEVKSGKSQLNKKQRMIRDLIKEGKVSFEIYRVAGNE